MILQSPNASVCTRCNQELRFERVPSLSDLAPAAIRRYLLDQLLQLPP
jgi:hypothetical protein